MHVYQAHQLTSNDHVTYMQPLLFHATSSFIFEFSVDKPRNARKRRTSSPLARPLGTSPFSSSLPPVLTPFCTRPAPHANYSHARDLACKLHVNFELSLFFQLPRQLELHANKDRLFSKTLRLPPVRMSHQGQRAFPHSKSYKNAMQRK